MIIPLIQDIIFKVLDLFDTRSKNQKYYIYNDKKGEKQHIIILKSLESANVHFYFFDNHNWIIFL